MQPENALLPMLITELGIVMEVRLEQFLKDESLMRVTDLGIVIEVIFVQPSKALFPMTVTELGMAIDVKLEHP